MASVYYKISVRHSAGTTSELYIRFAHGHEIDTQVLSGIVVPTASWDAKKQKLIGASRKFMSKDSRELLEIQSQMDDLRIFVLDKWVAEHEKMTIDKAWLSGVVAAYHAGGVADSPQLLSEVIDDYVRDSGILPGTASHYGVLRRMLERFAAAGHPLYINNVTVQDLHAFTVFLRREVSADGEVIERGQNTVNSKLRKLKAICTWLVETDRAASNPFAKFKIAEDVYGTPTYLTIEERDALYNYPFEKECDRQQRDIFVFQCHIGCRVSDLMALTPDNIGDDGMLSYIQTKLRRSNPQVVRVPLSPTALEIIERYKGKCGKSLLPFITDVKYNVAIKRVLRIAGIDRKVLVQDKKDYSESLVPLYEVASSHMARRTFLANLYKKVRSERIVSSFSGHASGSQALKRYTDIDDEMKKEIMEEMNGESRK